MSQKMVASRSSAKAKTAETTEETQGLITDVLPSSPNPPLRRISTRLGQTVRVGLRGGRNRQYTLAQKLAARTIKQPSGCWEVQGCKSNQAGHVALSIGSPRVKPYVRVLAHRFAWEQANGKRIPAGMVVMHACDNPRCVNPAHLSVGTQADNIHDSIRKGRYNVFGRQKLNAAQVLDIRALAARGVLQKVIARQFGVARNTISGIVNRKSWDHLAPFVAPADDRLNNVEPVAPSEAVEVLSQFRRRASESDQTVEAR